MAQTTVLTLLPQTPYNPTTNTVRGSKQPAASYYLASSDLQTVSWNINSFSGTLTIQVSLSTSPDEATDNDWFTVHTVPYGSTSGTFYTNINGNFVWIRAKISNFTQGVIQYIRVSY
jgi:hypothetical protein